MRFQHVIPCIASLALVTAIPRLCADASAFHVDVSPQNGAPAKVTVAGRALPLTGAGGFSVTDAATRQPIGLSGGRLVTAGVPSEFEVSGPELRLHARFIPVGDRLDITGEVESVSRRERGLVVEYRVPGWGKGIVFSSELDASHPIETNRYEENAYPIGAAFDGKVGLAVAIPPSHPCAFGITADAGGLLIRFYLGVSPDTVRFPNHAGFAFTLYPVDGEEGFRSALAHYYRFYPDYYTPRLARDGLWMFQMENRVPPNVEQYGFDETEPTSPFFAAAEARDEKYGIPIFPYTIVGQREIKFLPALPKDYAEAVRALRDWRPGERQLSKEDVSAEMANHLKDEIESSACTMSDGRYALVVRNTPWGKNSVSFKTDPSPYLFEGEGKYTVGADTLKQVREWLRDHPEFAGVYVDSLGANWPATLDYRHDHFTNVRHPLTIDPEGRVALQNDVSHYELLAALRALLRENGKLLMGNGVYAYQSRGSVRRHVEVQTFDNQLNEFLDSAAPPEHYHAGARLGRFFDAALLDVAGSEAGINASVTRCQDARVFMGRKPYAFLNYRWQNKALVDEMVNKSLAYAIFATCSKDFMTNTEYERNPDGYYRDKALWDWFVPLARLLSRAGWEPVRHARILDGQVVCERYGSGKDVYYALYNNEKGAKRCVLQVDLPRLGMRPDAVEIAEIGRHSAVSLSGGQVTLTLEPKKTYVLRVQPKASGGA